jgi:hypothetical protein
VQCAAVLAAQSEAEALFGSPFCTMFAAVGDRAGADEVLVGRNFDWSEDERLVVIDAVNERGRRFVRIGFGWNTGAFTAMNDAGLVVCAERAGSLGRPTIDGPPVDLVLRELVERADGLDAAMARLQAVSHLRGYRVLVTDAFSARVVEFGDQTLVREPSNGLLLGADPDGLETSDSVRYRYRRAAELLEDERIVSVSEIQTVLADSAPEHSGHERIFNDMTRACVVFVPKAKKMYLGFRQNDGSFSEYIPIDMRATGKPAGTTS